MASHKRLLAAVLCTVAAGSVAVALAGCSDDVPDDAVAKVGDTVIPKSEFDRWLRISAAIDTDAEGPAYDPSDRAACVAAKRDQAGGDGGPPLDARLERQCQRELEERKAEVMELLIREEWVTREAVEQEVEVGDAAVERALRERRRFFPSAAKFRQRLERSGMTPGDLRSYLRIELLEGRLRDKAADRRAVVSAEAVRAYYEQNAQRFLEPERRDIVLLSTKTRERAQKARAALEAGRSWGRVARDHSAGQSSDPNGRWMRGITRQRLDGTLESAVFEATEGRLVGPFRHGSRWYLLEVRSIEPRRRRPLEEAREEIREILNSERLLAVEEFEQALVDEYRELTTCAKGYLVALCEDGPEEAEGDEGA